MLSFNGKSVDRDDCFYCFKTPFDPRGLFISTETNKSYCSTHLKQHYKQYPDDSIYINLSKTRKEPVQKEPKQIKLEIKQESESDLFDVSTNLYQYDGENLYKVDDEAIDEDTKEIIDQIINSNSTNKSEELKSWQLDIQPCEHTIDFQQTPIKDIDLTHCGECELKENLWICLTCGKLGCGRAQFGGVAGNTHALKHFELTGHPIAVKLGSLSKDVTDVYCYSCNDEIKVPELSKYLKTYGIDLNTFTKTEKSLVELQIEQNLQWEFNLENENGEKLPSISGPELTGLKNLGNSCYLSSVSQVLFSLPEYKSKFNIASDLPESDSLDFQLVKLAKGLISGEFSTPNDQGYQVGIAPSSFKRLIGANNEEFSSMRQQDAFEFWNYLLEKVDSVDPELNDIFRFITIEKLKLDENKVKLKTQIGENLTLPIEIEVESINEGVKKYKRQDFIDGLISYLTPEEIEFKGNQCYKSTFFETFPKYLVTSIQRIQLENWVPIKTDVPLTLPEEFDLKDFQPDEVLDDNEVEIEDDEDETNEFQPNEESLNNLLQMGFPENRAKKAIFVTGNSSNPEIAMNWLFEHMEDPTIDDPIDFKKSTKAKNDVDESKISSLQDMGFSYQLSKKALILNNEDVNASIEWLFSNPDDDGVIPEEPSTNKSTDSKLDNLSKLSNNSRYKLKAVICHKGTQVTSGHYVAFIKKGDRWVLFNDEKVIDVTNDTKSWSEIERNGYIYIWESL